MTIQMRDICQYFYVVLFIVLYQVMLWIKPWSGTIQMKATEQHFHVVLFNMFYKMVLTLKYGKCVDKTLLCDHSNESYWTVLSCDTVYCAVQILHDFKN